MTMIIMANILLTRVVLMIKIITIIMLITVTAATTTMMMIMTTTMTIENDNYSETIIRKNAIRITIIPIKLPITRRTKNGNKNKNTTIVKKVIAIIVP